MAKKSLIVVSALAPLAASAAISTPSDIVNLTCNVLSYVFTFAVIFGVISILVSAIKYLTAGGDAQKVGEAHKALIYAIIGITVAIAAKSIPVIISNVFGITLGTFC